MINDFAGARFAFAKLIVNNLDRSAAFYRTVCEYGEGQWVEADLAGRPIAEVIFRKPEGGMELAILAYLDGTTSAAGDVTIAFDTADLDAFEHRLVAAGGTIVAPIKALEFGGNSLRIAFYRDIDGYLLEVMER
ncbi:hypothetical protein Q4F19_09235 [Sphingomonas sp. BIUV-7]|uniref:VOC domain-containing protein n=1 Tax=Sphingomonas natans TaxID=3063330 RepID=A0ABT8Y8A3_9SPHN|nr:VOC family protein [Sphingomonas sp. BIUV-7]MDO6414562.1 hypothetical protein [Sphingomonas sp. BIUV-7]